MVGQASDTDINADPDCDNIVVLDYYSERNRGDAAIQVELINILREQFPGADLSICSANRITEPDFKDEHLAETQRQDVTIESGLVPKLPFEQILGRIPFFKPLYILFFRITVLLLLTLRPSQSILKRTLPNEMVSTLDTIEDADLVVWRGGNFRLHGNPHREIFQSLGWVFHPLICASYQKPMVCVGVSMWETPSSISERLFRYTFNQCYLVATRERISQKRVTRITEGNDTDVILIPDLVPRLVNRSVGDQSKKNTPDLDGDDVTVGVTIVDRHEPGSLAQKNYIESMKQMLLHILANTNANIVVIPQATTPWEDVSEIKTEILADLDADRVENNREELTIDELLEMYSEADVMLATRLHSSVFALSTGTPTFIMRYDLGPQWDIVRMIGAGDYLMNYRELQPQDILTEFESFWDDIDEYPIESILDNYDELSLRVENESGKLRTMYKPAE